MLHLRFLSVLVAVSFGLLLTNVCEAQRFQPFGPMDFDLDFDIFAPPDDSSYGNGPKPNVGPFVTYDRLYWNVGRPAAATEPNEMDLTWGNRFQLGYMTDDEHGWLLGIMHVDGPNNVARTPFPAPGGNPLNPFPGVGAAPIERGVENSMDFQSVELMKQWRFKRLWHGSYVDTFVGFRYARLMHHDNLVRNNFRFPLNGLAIENNMFGPQAGLRWFKQKGRWTFSSEGRYYYAFNDQFFASRSFVENGGEPFNEERWVQAGDIRFNVTYDVSKSFALSAGWEALYMANGVGRGLPPANDQDVLFSGFTFGMVFNR